MYRIHHAIVQFHSTCSVPSRCAGRKPNSDNSITGSYSTVETDSGSSTVNTQETNQSLFVTTHETSTDQSTSTETGNEITGFYTLTETGYGQTTTIEIDTNGPQTISLSQTETDTNSSTTTGNNITGDSAETGTEISNVQLSVNETNQTLSVTANENDTTTVSQVSTSNNITGAYSTGEISTSDTSRAETITNQTLVINDGTKQHHITGTSTETVNNITGAYSLVESTSDTFTNSETDTNQTLTSSEVETGLTNETDTEAGNNIAGSATGTSDSQTYDTVTEYDSNQAFILTSTLVTVAISSAVSATNEITGDTSSSTHETSTSTQSEIEANSAGSGAGQGGGDGGDDTSDGQTVSYTETGSGLSDSIDVGNTISGSDSQSESSSETTTTVQTNVVASPPPSTGDGQGGGSDDGTDDSTDSLSDGGTQTTTDTTSLTQTGNTVTGDYSLTEIDASSTTLNQSGITSSPLPTGEGQGEGDGDDSSDQTRTFTLLETTTVSSTLTESGNSLTGLSTSTTTATSSDTLTKTDTYVGQISQPAGESDYDSQTVITTDSSTATSTSNSLTGSTTEADNDTTTVVTLESGLRSGQTYSLADTDTTTVADQTSSNSVTGDQTTTETSAESSSLSNSASPLPLGEGQGEGSSAGSFSLLETDGITTTLTSTSNLITGSYSETAVETSSTVVGQVSQPASGTSTTATNTDNLLLTRTETGNSITGDFSRTVTESDSTTLVESGTVMPSQGGDGSPVSFTLSETTYATPMTITEAGNSVTGDYTLIETGTTTYTVDQSINLPPPSGGGQGGGNDGLPSGPTGTTWYSLHETGTNPTTLTQTGNTVTGDYSQTITGTDSYTLSETGELINDIGDHTYTETQIAADTSTVVEIGNSLNGQFQRTTTGAILGTMTETGDDNGVGYVRPSDVSTGYTVTNTGNYVDGSVSLSEIGTDRYSLLEQFTNISNALAGNGPGNVDYSPTGTPFTMGEGPAVPTSGTAYPGEQSPAAAEQDPFAQQGLDLLHEYCFADESIAGNSFGPSWAIGNSEDGRPLESRHDSDPTGPLVKTWIEKVYRNGKKPVMRVHFDGGFVRVTHNRPWFVKGDKWIASSQLQSGDLLLDDKGLWVPVDRAQDLGETADVFNLRIAGTHTFHISNGKGRFVQVHNESKEEASSPGSTTVQGPNVGPSAAAIAEAKQNDEANRTRIEKFGDEEYTAGFRQRMQREFEERDWPDAVPGFAEAAWDRMKFAALHPIDYTTEMVSGVISFIKNPGKDIADSIIENRGGPRPWREGGRMLGTMAVDAGITAAVTEGVGAGIKKLGPGGGRLKAGIPAETEVRSAAPIGEQKVATPVETQGKTGALQLENIKETPVAGERSVPSQFAHEIPERVAANDLAQQDLLKNQQKRLKEAMENAPPGQKAKAKGRVLNDQGGDFQDLSTDTLKQIPDADVGENVKIGKGTGSQLDNEVVRGNKTVYIESKLTLATLDDRIINQLNNAVKKSGSVILNVAREPTVAELAKLKKALGDEVFGKVKVVSTQKGLFEAVSSALE